MVRQYTIDVAGFPARTTRIDTGGHADQLHLSNTRAENRAAVEAQTPPPSGRGGVAAAPDLRSVSPVRW